MQIPLVGRPAAPGQAPGNGLDEVRLRVVCTVALIAGSGRRKHARQVARFAPGQPQQHLVMAAFDGNAQSKSPPDLGQTRRLQSFHDQRTGGPDQGLASSLSPTQAADEFAIVVRKTGGARKSRMDGRRRLLQTGPVLR
jgi:hypothetical protein